MSLAASVKMIVQAQKTLSGDLGGGAFHAAVQAIQSFTDGAGAGAVNQIFGDTRTIAASANEDLDVATGGGLVDVTGEAVAMARIKAIAIFAAAANVNNVRLTRPSSNGVPLFLAAGDGIDIRPGGCFLWMAPDATGVVVTAATADLINIANSSSGSGVTYSILILGAAT